MSTQTYTKILTVLECADCGTLFGITEQFEKARRKDHRNFYCPRGHSLSYLGPSIEERLRKELTQAQEEANRKATALDRERAIHASTKKSRDAFKGHLKRTKKRVGNGVCPCCNRTFQNLARHMSGQHPDYGEKR